MNINELIQKINEKSAISKTIDADKNSLIGIYLKQDHSFEILYETYINYHNRVHDGKSFSELIHAKNILTPIINKIAYDDGLEVPLL